VLGSRSASVFPAKIAKGAKIGDLKNLIKEKKSHAFQHVDADDLDLLQVRPYSGRHC